MPEAISSYAIEDDRIVINTPYSDRIIRVCRSWGGKWNGSAWILPLSRLPDIQEHIGKNQDDLVQVDVPVTHPACDDGQQLDLDWHILAARKTRDGRPNIYAELTTGRIPAYGGSVKHPRVAASSDAIFRLWVPRDFAIRHELIIIADPKVTEPASDESAELIAERERLLIRLAEIDARIPR